MRRTLLPALLAAALPFAPVPDATAALVVVPLNRGADWKFVEVTLPPTGTVAGISHHGVHDPAARSIKWGPLSPRLEAVVFDLRGAPAGGSVAVLTAPTAAAAADNLELPTDADGDGIPASEEDRLGLSDGDPDDAGGDLDGDGQDNLAEFLAGTAADDAASQPTVRSVRYDEEAEALVIELTAGRTDTVRVETAVRLDAEEWIEFPGWEIDAARPSELRLPLPPGELGRRFIRLRWGDVRVTAR